MVFSYIRVSTDKQSVENQRHQINDYLVRNRLILNEEVYEVVSGTYSVADRKLGELLDRVSEGDTIIITEMSRLGRSLIDIMDVLIRCVRAKVTVVSLKEGHTLDDSINGKVITFAFSLAAEIERELISQRTKEALSRLKAEGKSLGRPKGSRNKKPGKLAGKEKEIQKMVEARVPVMAISRLLGVNRATVTSFIKRINSMD